MVNYTKGILSLRKVYLLVLLEITNANDTKQEDYDKNRITVKDINAYFQANILLHFGSLGYIDFPLKILYFSKDNFTIIFETNINCLSKFELIVANHFPTTCPIDMNIILQNSSSNFKFIILNYNHNLSALINNEKGKSSREED